MVRLAPLRRRDQIDDVVLREAKREAAEAERMARLASQHATAASRPGRSFDASAGAAARTAELAAASASAAQRAAFLLDLRLKLAESTTTYRPWQQIPAWVLGGAGIALAFILVFTADDAVGGWAVAALMLALGVISSFRGPADLSFGTGPKSSGGDEPNEPEAPEQPDGDAVGGEARGDADLAPDAAPATAVPSAKPETRPAIRHKGLRFLATGLDYRSRTRLFSGWSVEEFVDRLHEHLAANAEEMRSVTANTQYANRVRGERERPHLPDLGDPRAAGWTFLVSEDDPELPAIVEAMRPLATHRGMRDPEQPLLYRADIHWTDWLTERYQAMEPRERPYYVLVVGEAERVPFHFQALLDSTASVGRVAFDSIDDLRAYAEKVVRLETAPEPAAEPKALFFAPDGGPEDATFFSRRYLAEPLSKVAAEMEVDVRLLAESGATKSNLADLLATTPYALVYTASHGIGAPTEPLDVQRQVNGAICCQDTEQDSLFGALDVPAGDGPYLEGAAVFQFACYGYGTPADSDFMHWLGEPTFNAEADFVAALPKRLLAHPRGPIAFIGHIDTAWLHGFDDPDNPLIVDPYHERLRPFETAVSALLTVQPVGLALAELNKRYDVLNGVLAGELDRMGRRASGLTPELVARLADTFIFRSDAQNYAVLGDPGVSVRLPQA